MKRWRRFSILRPQAYRLCWHLGFSWRISLNFTLVGVKISDKIHIFSFNPAAWHLTFSWGISLILLLFDIIFPLNTAFWAERMRFICYIFGGNGRRIKKCLIGWGYRRGVVLDLLILIFNATYLFHHNIFPIIHSLIGEVLTLVLFVVLPLQSPIFCLFLHIALFFCLFYESEIFLNVLLVLIIVSQ